MDATLHTFAIVFHLITLRRFSRTKNLPSQDINKKIYPRVLLTYSLPWVKGSVH